MARPSPAAKAFEDALGAKPPAGLVKALSAEDLQALADTVAATRTRQREELEEAVDKAFDFVPRLLRGTIKRIAGAGR